MEPQSLAHPFASAGGLLIWLAAVSVAIATIWRTWLRHVFRRMRQGVEAMIELRDLLKTELHLPGDGAPGAEPRTSLREDLQALTAEVSKAAAGLARGAARFDEHQRRLDEHDGRIGALESATGKDAA